LLCFLKVLFIPFSVACYLDVLVRAKQQSQAKRHKITMIKRLGEGFLAFPMRYVLACCLLVPLQTLWTWQMRLLGLPDFRFYLTTVVDAVVAKNVKVLDSL